ncbi:MAG TPA: 5'/3'-nucleotidase SurE [Polyangiales bacterium]|nr:5'/3'-nucleotidase SurE [Polyangiales bacterium]
MRFLLTNDDGIEARGLALLVDVCARLGELTVVAPDCEQSGVGHRVSTRAPLKLTQSERGYALSGTPADCARVGLRALESAADWVISGLNHGGNMGVDINMSGTVAGAREGAILGTQAIAISQVLSSRHPPDVARMTTTTERVLRQLIARPLAQGQLYNVNLPFAPESDEPEIVFCGPDPSPHDVKFDSVEGGYKYSGVFLNRPRQKGLDVDVVFAGKIAVSVLTTV